MKRELLKGSVLLLILLLLLPLAVQAGLETGEGDSSGGSSGGGGGGGGSKQITIDNVLKVVKDAKNQKSPKLEELKTLLYMEPYSEISYDANMGLGLNITGGRTLSRNDKFEIVATVVNPNPLKIRRALYLDLEILEPGENAFKNANMAQQIIQINEYKVGKDGKNQSTRLFPDLTSFAHLKKVGPVILRLYATDGVYKWRSKNLTLNVTNQVPTMSDINISSVANPRYNDAVFYEANVTDPDGDAVNVTLHVLDEHEKEKGNLTQIVEGTGQVRIIGNKFFTKSDAGKSFYYYYTFGDGIDVNRTDVQSGPRFRKSVTIFVQNPTVKAADQNQYWWQGYNFTMDIKNQDLEPAQVTVTLYTDTSAHPWKPAASKEVILTQEMKTIWFDIQPFDVLDANETFSFKFDYSEPDQNEELSKEVNWDRPINAKLVKYETVSALGIGNVLLIFMLALMLGMIFERRFYR